ncbi:hypothetical protein P171DRAFT_430721 [Karstenula rhodostoma CBS 690.94]|uniref:Uncharacterized protein n=1 Tax=Karstenula rhodostoma CBS 690.94 TaxID=1392251 RepID=A0A9P4PM90_9PLEO|nr:hypothetical protein P171DRAFT_430721 [Karstenula rhodostoma CBS 690.94]
MRYQETVITTMAVCLASVGANPLQSHKRDATPQYSGVTTCLQKVYPNFPAEGKPTPEEARNCLQEQTHAKRADRLHARDESLEAGELIYEPDTGGVATVQPRGLVESVLRLGKNLYIDKSPFCYGTEVHDNFVWVDDVRAKSNEICQQLREQIDASGLKQDGGVGIVFDHLTNGHDKQGHQLKDKRKVTATYLLTFIPPAKTTIDGIKEIASGVYDLCNDGIEKLATKDLGCTQDIGYYRPSKAKHYTDTAAIGGQFRMFFDGVADSVADLSLTFSEDG